VPDELTIPDLPAEERIALAIGAHPDDTDFGVAGAVAYLSQAGWTVYHLICTNGAKGTADPGMDPARLIALRREEQRAAAKTVGGKEVFFLDYEDGELQPTRDLLKDIVYHIRRLRPHTVLTHDPSDIIVRDAFINHPDHRATGTAVLDAVYPTARDHLNFPEQIAEGLTTHKVRRILLWGSNHPNYTLDIGKVLELKVESLLCHASQLGGREDFLKFVEERWKNDEGRYTEQLRKVEFRF
jgi:LmbE family N-acetylglucosaminyl deacetylase